MRTSTTEIPAQQAQPHFEVLDARQLAARLSVPRTWVLEQTRARCEDKIPHLKLGKYCRFVLDKNFWQWLERRRKGGKQ